MGESELIRKVQMDCPLCGKIHEVEERKRITATIIKDTRVSYEETYFYCVNAGEEGNEFETGVMMNANLMNARNAYRQDMGLLTSDEIVAIRESYGLFQVDLARILGWGEATVSRYERKAIQDKAYDTMLRLIKDNPLKALELLKKMEVRFRNKENMLFEIKLLKKLIHMERSFLRGRRLKGNMQIMMSPQI